MIEFLLFLQIITITILFGMMKGLDRIENKIAEVES